MRYFETASSTKHHHHHSITTILWAATRNGATHHSAIMQCSEKDIYGTTKLARVYLHDDSHTRNHIVIVVVENFSCIIQSFRLFRSFFFRKYSTNCTVTCHP
jgi:hypothetical protein